MIQTNKLRDMWNKFMEEKVDEELRVSLDDIYDVPEDDNAEVDELEFIKIMMKNYAEEFKVGSDNDKKIEKEIDIINDVKRILKEAEDDLEELR